ncbi:MAG TPA: MFS transporter [Gemmatimonadaceae bacterium]
MSPVPPRSTVAGPPPGVSLGLRENWRQFWLLVLVNAFVGAMVGLERTVLPLLAEEEFGLASKGAVLSFIATFGAVKAVTNLFAGRLGDLYGRRRILLAGWFFAIPVPFLVMWAPSWGWIIFANVLLGINQGLAWSTTVIMKIDLVGPKQRGLAMGLNEFAGYLAVALAALTTGWVAEAWGLRPEPFYLGLAFAAAGLGLTLLFVRETHHHVALEAEGFQRPTLAASPQNDASDLGTREIFVRASWRDPALSTASHAGMVNNLNDGLAWGLFPLFFAAGGLSVGHIGVLSFLYPAVWGVLQLWTGALSDRWGRKQLIAGGMMLQGVALASIALGSGFPAWAAGATVLGVGTAMVYPTLLASIVHPRWRGLAVGVYRLWRDAGYAVGALIAGALADLFGMTTAIGAVAILTFLSGVQVAWRMPETLHRSGAHRPAAE